MLMLSFAPPSFLAHWQPFDVQLIRLFAWWLPGASFMVNIIFKINKSFLLTDD
jgi:hypothetical protein